MRLEFGVLWFENQPDDVRGQRKEIEEYIEELGFKPRIEMLSDGDEVEILAERQRLYDDFEIVLVDYDLGQAGKGDKLAGRIRKGFGFTDIVFYSGLTTVDLRNLVHKAQIDGVYCMERRHLADRLEGRIDEAARRLSRLEGMRGLAMGIVGKCDAALKSILLSEYEAAEADKKTEIVDQLDTLVTQSAAAMRDKYGKAETFRDRLHSRTVTSFHLYKLALHLTKGREACKEHREILKSYNTAVLDLRNVLGHVAEVRGPRGWEISKDADASINIEDFPELRREMARHFDNIVALGEILAATGIQKAS
ncbi:hypothetical protein [Caenispirillum bisanense]|uniref:Response regulator receiver domain-containing protein n=1 Tax=Caenispirillum bisanense TaxID=414052 RepID=A0A286H2B5_9PROT|nr:hypothetical protein [Caenispirillum bisanense]SOE01832.1 hypothetical protein SAMN05421508_1277 [Caenispirillum bisanense]